MLTIIVTITGGLYAVPTVTMKIMGGLIAVVTIVVTITGRSICSANSYYENNGEV